jgi:hypothetical protein
MVELNENYIIDEIVEIKKIGIEETIDIEVDGDNLFLCNDILTHNSAAGDVADVTEESIQGGISKIQSADNVIAFIPNAKSREMGILRAKMLKTRDSSGVGTYLTFKTEWKTLSFIPMEKDENGSWVEITENNQLSKEELKSKLKNKTYNIDNSKNENQQIDEKQFDEYNENKKSKSIENEVENNKNKKTNLIENEDEGLKLTKKGRKNDISGIKLINRIKKV